MYAFKDNFVNKELTLEFLSGKEMPGVLKYIIFVSAFYLVLFKGFYLCP